MSMSGIGPQGQLHATVGFDVWGGGGGGGGAQGLPLLKVSIVQVVDLWHDCC